MFSLFSVMLVLHWSGDFLCGLKILVTSKNSYNLIVFLSGLWIQFHVLCPKWCSACWDEWSAE